jgi:hypothetical protein
LETAEQFLQLLRPEFLEGKLSRELRELM